MYVTGVVDGWDSGCCGFATVKINDVKNDYKDRNDWVKSVNLFLDELNRSENGECYIVSLLDPENVDFWVQAKRHEVVQVSYSIA